jgi:hypothetical protein
MIYVGKKLPPLNHKYKAKAFIYIYKTTCVGTFYTAVIAFLFRALFVRISHYNLYHLLPLFYGKC